MAPPRKKKAAPTKSAKTAKKSLQKATPAPPASEARTVQAEIVEPSATAKPSSKNALVPMDYTPALNDPVATYLSEIRRYPLLTREQEQDIAKQYHETGDPKLAEILVTSNLRFVVKIAAEYAKFGSRLIDLIQEGNVGLMHAVKEFNPYKGVKLITYAVWWIRGYIQEHLMKQYSMVRIGTTQNQRKLFYQLQREREELEKNGDPAQLKQLSERLGVSESEIELMTQRMSGRDISLDQPLDDNSPTSLMDLQREEHGIAIDEQLSHMELLEKLSQNIEKVRPSLSEREIILLETRLLADEPLTLQEIGDRYGITREAVRQMEGRLLEKIKRAFLADVGESEPDAEN